jgi:hypothetical protein
MHFKIFDFVTVCMDDLVSDDTKNYCEASHNMLVIVDSKEGYIEKRTRIRNTWANIHRMNTSYTKTMFVTGKYVCCLSSEESFVTLYRRGGGGTPC